MRHAIYLILFLIAGNSMAQVTFSDQLIITTDADGANAVFSADLDGDGDYDVLSASMEDNKIAWYENTDGLGSFGPQQVITTDADHAEGVFSADLDGDWDNDVLSASWEDDKVAWYENTDGLGSFGPQQVITTTADHAGTVFSVDLDGDGDNDVLSASAMDDKVAWYENTDGLGSFGAQQIITTFAEHVSSVFSADLDGDGDNDVLSASLEDSKIAWYENSDGLGSFGAQQIISTDAYEARSVFSCDLDGDLDNDVLSASWSDNKIAWYENTDGLGNFGQQRIISTEANGTNSVFSADLDGDLDNDVLSASWNESKIAWYENTDGLGNFGPQQIVTTSANGALSVFSADLDGNGSYDILSASMLDDKIAWYRNEGGTGVDDDQPNPTIPKAYRIQSIHPNPFNPTTTITFDLPAVSQVKLDVFDINGRIVGARRASPYITTRQYSAGTHAIPFDGSNLSSGIYIYRLAAGNFTASGKMVLLK